MASSENSVHNVTMELFVLGRLADLSLAELESIYGDNLKVVGDGFAIVSGQSSYIASLGGSTRIAKVLAEVLDFDELKKVLAEQINVWAPEGSGRLNFGLSFYGLKIAPREAAALGLQLKKTWSKTLNRTIRFVFKESAQLSSAQVIHNGLDSDGLELIVASTNNKIYIAKTKSVQNIAAYSKRDFDRPKRDARVGMLPPKLAQIMINLASGGQAGPILDPFCGTGVLLQEALLQRRAAIGSDIDPRMIDYTRENLAWLEQEFGTNSTYKAQVQDATVGKWDITPGTFIVTEGWLGPALHHLPANLYDIKSQVRQTMLNFLENLYPQLPIGSRICLTLPKWKTKDGWTGLGILEQIQSKGYNLVQFSSSRDLIYSRPGQIVARQLITLRRI